MDDLNADGKIDYKDAAVFYKIVDDQYGDSKWAPFVGGLDSQPHAKSRTLCPCGCAWFPVALGRLSEAWSA